MGDLRAHSHALARGMLTVCSPGDKVMGWMKTRAERVAAQFAAASAGLEFVDLHGDYDDDTIKAFIANSGSRMVILDEDLANEALLSSIAESGSVVLHTGVRPVAGTHRLRDFAVPSC